MRRPSFPFSLLVHLIAIDTMHIFDGQFASAVAVVAPAGTADETDGNDLVHATFAGVKAGAEAF